MTTPVNGSPARTVKTGGASDALDSSECAVEVDANAKAQSASTETRTFIGNTVLPRQLVGAVRVFAVTKCIIQTGRRVSAVLR
jgi:hypothetical protein